MQEIQNKFPQEIFYDSLEIINGVRFTSREMDIIAFIFNRRSTKEKANFFSISPKTVSNHIRNIMGKMQCNSREEIITYILRYNKAAPLKEYYKSTIVQINFENSLIQLSTLINKNISIKLYVLSSQNINDKLYFLTLFKNHLIQSGFKLNLEISNDREALTNEDKIHSNHRSSYIIINESASKIFKIVPSKIFYKQNNKKKIVALPDILSINNFETLTKLSSNSDSCNYIIDCAENYYEKFFILLGYIFPDMNFDSIEEDFKKNNQLIYQPEENIRGILPPQKIEKRKTLTDTIKNIWYWIVICSTILGFAIAIIYNYFIQKNLFNNKNNPNTLYIGSDLNIIPSPLLLQRPKLVNEIQKILLSNKGLTTLALIGIGGAGKTTLARYFALNQNFNVVWEINASTKENIISSIERLAVELCAGQEDKRKLKDFQEITDAKQRMEKTIAFVKQRLKEKENWLLIFDDVENFAQVMPYFPSNEKLWGNGKVIVTTRDANMQNNNHINHIIHVGELDHIEKLQLFKNIMRTDRSLQIDRIDQAQIQEFINFIPPFPLDIAIAAYYIKSTNVSYSKYLSHIKNPTNEFSNIQENIIKESSSYSTIRSKIIDLTLENLINKDKYFAEFLLLISLIDAQHIPISLLSSYGGDTKVEKFIYYLKKYSLIIPNSSLSLHSLTFSIHRSTQLACLTYLLKRFSTEKKDLLTLVSNILENYIKGLIDSEDISGIRLMLGHSKQFLSHTNLLDNEMSGSIKGELGCIYFYLGNLSKARKSLEESLSELKYNYAENTEKSPHKIAPLLAYWGSIHKELGNYKDAIILLNESLIAYKQNPSHYYPGAWAWVFALLGTVHSDLGNYQKAQDFFEQSLMEYKQQKTDNLIGIGWVLGLLGNVQRIRGNYKEAQRLLNRSITVYEENYPEDHIRKAEFQIYLALVNKDLGNYQIARSLIEKSLLIYRKNYSAQHNYIAWVLTELAIVHGEIGNYNKAKALFTQSLAIYETNNSTNQIQVGWLLASLGNIHNNLKEYKEAKELLEKSLLIFKRQSLTNPTVLAWILGRLGNVHKNLQNYEIARDLLQESYTIYNKHFSESHIDIAWTLASLGDVYSNLNDKVNASRLIKESIKIYKNHFLTNMISKEQSIKYIKNTFQNFKIYKELIHSYD